MIIICVIIIMIMIMIMIGVIAVIIAITGILIGALLNFIIGVSKGWLFGAGQCRGREMHLGDSWGKPQCSQKAYN